jgi:hypothetical protein
MAPDLLAYPTFRAMDWPLILAPIQGSHEIESVEDRRFSSLPGSTVTQFF